MGDLQLWSAFLSGLAATLTYHWGRKVGRDRTLRTDRREKAHIWEDAHTVGYWHGRKTPPTDRTESGADHARATNPFL